MSDLDSVDFFVKMFFNTQHFERNGDQQDGYARYKITVKNAFCPELACTIQKRALATFMNFFVDIDASTDKALCFGDFGGMEGSDYVVVGPHMIYFNSGNLRYLATDLLRVSSAAEKTRVFNLFYSGRGNDWREI